MSIKGGSIYYTVGVDRKSLADAIRQVEALGKAAARANGVYAQSNSVLSKYEDEVKKLSASIKTLNNDFQAGSKDPAKYRAEMAVLEQDALALRGAIENLGSSVVATSQDEARAAQMTQNLSAALKETSGVVAGSKGQYDSMGMGIKSASQVLVELNAKVRQATQQFESGELSAQQYAQRLAELRVRFDAVGTEVNQLSQGMNLNRRQSMELARAHGQVTRGLTAIQKGTTRATGATTTMAMAQQLSFGATTLMNDQIFRMSPALGIVTNQLMFTTKGFQAWMRVMVPIVAVAGTLIGIITTLVVSLRAGVGLEAALADVRKTTNLTDQELVKLTTTFQSLSKEIPVSTMELLGIARVAGQLGITGLANIENFTDAIAKLSIATDIVGEEGATSLARFLQATGTGVDQLGAVAQQVGNILNELENTSAATAAEILSATSYTQGLASQAGASRAEILGLNAALLSLGVKAEAGGSAVVRSIAKIQTATVDGGSALRAFADAAGMTVENFAALVEDSPIEAYRALAQGMHDTAEAGGNLNEVLAEIGIREVRERRALLALAQGVDTFTSSLESANREAFLMTSLQKEVAIQSNTAEALMKRLGSRFSTMTQQLGIALVPAFKALLWALIGIVDAVSGLIAGWNGLMAMFGAASTGIPRVTAEYRTLNSEMEEHSAQADAATVALGKLANVSSRSGLMGVIQELAASLNEEGREALGNFAEATILPLLAQGKLKDAAMATAEFMSKDLVRAAKVGELEALRSLQSIDSANYESARARVAFYSDEILRLERAARDAGSPANAAGFLMERDAMQDALGSISPDFYRLREVVGNRAKEIEGLVGDVEYIDEAIAAIVNINSFEDLQAWAAEFFNSPLSLFDGFDGDDDDTDIEDRLDRIADIYARLAAAREEIAKKAEAYGWDDLETAEALVGAVSSAIDGLIGEGVELDNMSLAGLIAEWADLKDGIIGTALAQSEFGRQMDLWRQAQTARFSGSNGETFTISAIARSAATFDEAMELLGRAGIEASDALLERVSDIRGEAIPDSYKVEEGAAGRMQGNQLRDARALQDEIDAVYEEYLQGQVDGERAWRAQQLKDARALQDEVDEVYEEYLEAEATAARERFAAEELARARGLQMRHDEGQERIAAEEVAAVALARWRASQLRDAQDLQAEIDTVYEEYNQEEVDALARWRAQQLRDARALQAEIDARLDELAEENAEARIAAEKRHGERVLQQLLDIEAAMYDPKPVDPPELTTTYGTLFGPAENVLGTFVSALANAAAQSDVIGSAFAAWKTVRDKEGNVISSGLDPMMFLFQIIGKVLERSEAFATAMAMLDTILDPLVVAFDSLLGAIMPTIEVIVALLTTALKPFVWIVTNVLAPVLNAVANTIKAIWNALARVIPWMKPATDADEEDDDEPEPGSIAWAEARASYYRDLEKNTANAADREYYRDKAEQYEELAARFAGREPSDDDASDSMSAGTQISAITGPTRDLLMDLLRPLSILPSWTSMIQDIRNDVRSIAMMGGFAPASFDTGGMAPVAAASVTNNSINIQSLTVNTQAKNARQLFDEISTLAYKDRRGGR